MVMLWHSIAIGAVRFCSEDGRITTAGLLTPRKRTVPVGLQAVPLWGLRSDSFMR